MTYTYEWNRGVHGGWDLSATSIDNPDESSWVRVHIFSHGMYYIYSGPGVVSSWGTLKKIKYVHDLKAQLLRDVLNADAHMRIMMDGRMRRQRKCVELGFLDCFRG